MRESTVYIKLDINRVKNYHQNSVFEGDRLEVIRSFPEQARWRCGHEIDRVQRNLKPKHWKPLSTIGRRVGEIKVRLDRQYRVVHILRGRTKLHILHAFIKKTGKIPTTDIEIAKRRLGYVIRREGQ